MRLADGRIRKLRTSCKQSGCAHELTFSCYNGKPLLADDRSREFMVDALARARQTHDFELWAYVIMPEHAHVLLLPRRADYRIAAILKSIKRSVARRAMRQLRASAPNALEAFRVMRPSGRVEFRFWQQGGGYDRNLINTDAAWAAVEYIHLNPVRRGLADAPADWRWSSARWYDGSTDVVLSMDGCPPTERVR